MAHTRLLILVTPVDLPMANIFDPSTRPMGKRRCEMWISNHYSKNSPTNWHYLVDISRTLPRRGRLTFRVLAASLTRCAFLRILHFFTELSKMIIQLDITVVSAEALALGILVVPLYDYVRLQLERNAWPIGASGVRFGSV